jgi:hypothetical protein
MSTLLLVVLLLLVFGGAPNWGYHQYGWGPSGIGGVVLIVLLVMLLTGRQDGAWFERFARGAIVAATLYARSKKWIDAELSALIIGGGLMIPVNGMSKTEAAKVVKTEAKAEARTDAKNP